MTGDGGTDGVSGMCLVILAISANWLEIIDGSQLIQPIICLVFQFITNKLY